MREQRHRSGSVEGLGAQRIKTVEDAGWRQASRLVLFHDKYHTMMRGVAARSTATFRRALMG